MRVVQYFQQEIPFVEYDLTCNLIWFTLRFEIAVADTLLSRWIDVLVVFRNLQADAFFSKLKSWKSCIQLSVIFNYFWWICTFNPKKKPHLLQCFFIVTAEVFKDLQGLCFGSFPFWLQCRFFLFHGTSLINENIILIP